MSFSSPVFFGDVDSSGPNLLERRVAELTAALETRDKLIATAAHELRGPLASIRGLTEMLCEGAMGAVAKEQLEILLTVRAAGQAALELANNLLSLMAGGGQAEALRITGEDPVELMRRCIGLQREAAARKHSRIVLEALVEDRSVAMDAARMRQVLTNLLNNALKFSPPGSVVTAAVKLSGDKCEFSVRDQGPGIPEAERHRLFQVFGRLSTTPTDGEQSTGIGLAVCEQIVRAHRGTIEVRNLERGCEFRAVIPAG